MDFNQILELIKTVSASELTAFQYEEGNQKIVMHTGNVAWNGVAVDMPAVANVSAPVNASGVMPAPSTAMPVNMAAVAAPVNAAPVATPVTASAAPAEASVGANAEGNLVKAPLVGRFYVAPSEDADPFVKVGDTVKKGQTLAIVEAMKLMNEIECEFDGVVAEVLVSDGEAVEYGQPLFRIV